MTVTTAAPGRVGGAVGWTLALTQFLLILDTAVLNVAVPHIADGVGLTRAEQSWVINAFVVPFAGLLLVSGYAADRIGRHRVLATGLSILALGAALGALAVNGPMVIVSRAVQGVGGALAGAAAMSLVFVLFTGPGRGKVLALFATMAGVGGVAGTVVGGTATEWLGWRSLFVLNVLAAIALLIAVKRTIPRDEPRGVTTTSPRQRRSGSFALTVALAAAAYAVTALASHSWRSPHVLIGTAVAVVALIMFIAVEWGAPSPIIPRRVWRNLPLLWALICSGTGQFVTTPLFLLVSIYAQQTMGYSPAAAGLVLLPMSVLIVTVAPTLPRLLPKLGERTLMVAGFVAAAGGALWLTTLHPDSGYITTVLGPTLLIGLGVPTIAVTTNLAAAAAAEGNIEPGITAGLLTTAQQFGAAMGLAVLPTIAISSAGYNGYNTAFLAAASVAAIAAILVSSRPLWGLSSCNQNS
ncbi:MFS transporter [Rhodococcus qingshengii]|uniref:MFS transporter n=1 Tax=Rhodococcus qingshengii TaxID=334542 RepID=UPI0010A69EF0|nr:MFS transporter [Rhodococcus qingshengii]THJ67652.1 MFS transporter [Rhodococcus qingshengii]